MVMMVLMAIIIFVISRASSDGLTGTFLFLSKYIFIPLIGMGAFLSISYVQKLVFDFSLQKIRSQSGFFWNLKKMEISFNQVDMLLVKARGAVVMKDPNMMKTSAVQMGWDLVLVSQPSLARPGILSRLIDSFSPELSRNLGVSFPGINFWRSPDKEKALNIANSLAKEIDCTVEVD